MLATNAARPWLPEEGVYGGRDRGNRGQDREQTGHQWHAKREIRAGRPVHITTHVAAGVPSLRTPELRALVTALLVEVQNRGVRIVAWFLRDVDRLSMSLLLRGQYTNVRAERFLQLLKSLARKEDPFAAASPLQLTDVERAETVAAIDGNVYEGLPKHRIVLLRRLSQLLQESPGPLESSETITVEHVLPQTVAEATQWATWYPNRADREYWTHRLGNLVLLSRRKNAAASNRSFAEKRDTYFAKGITPFALTVDVLAAESFDATVVERRHRRLVETLRLAFRL